MPRLSALLALALATTPALAGPFAGTVGPLPGADRLVPLDALPHATAPKAVEINPNRSYPPSCLSYPLPTTPRGTAIQKVITLADIDGNAAGANGASGYFESVAVTIWRHACSGGKSAILVKLARAANRVNTLPAPDVPISLGTQGTIMDGSLRLHVEPNTRFSDSVANTLLSEQVLVVDELPSANFDLNAALTLSLATVVGNNLSVTDTPLTAYNAATHPDGTQNLEINGYLTGSWYDETHPGEGILFEVGEQPNRSRFVFFSWFTYDATGRPYWLVGNANVANDARTITIPTLYFGGGGFA
ncbi:MAG TPA: hypothetical protein VFO79_00380, partial [Xanthomonadales bacterium]|nr:hypothetical protein [Xanthomonadales bacterium]